jgi:hypothetical protein
MGQMGQHQQFAPKCPKVTENLSERVITPNQSPGFPTLVRFGGGTVGHDTMLRRSFLSCPKSAAGSCDSLCSSRVAWVKLISASCICTLGAYNPRLPLISSLFNQSHVTLTPHPSNLINQFINRRANMTHHQRSNPNPSPTGPNPNQGQDQRRSILKTNPNLLALTLTP